MKSDETARYLVFVQRGALYALDLQDVAEVVEPPPTFPIPRAPAHFIGVMNFHGNLTTVLDLANLQDRGKFSTEGKVLVLDGRLANLAIWVDGVSAIIPAEAVQREPADEDDGLTAALLCSGADKIRLLALDRLLRRVEETIND